MRSGLALGAVAALSLLIMFSTQFRFGGCCTPAPAAPTE